ncbi:hypothetical protein BHM03_00036873 [Ensete ventricosum]|nr:hypothetical protein BHM03_00036873 [Ensete ventricosum]
MSNALRPSMKALVVKELLRHSDIDVKVAVASCVSEITRITAPEAPYDDDLMKVDDSKQSERTVSDELVQGSDKMEQEVNCPEEVTSTEKSPKSVMSNGTVLIGNGGSKTEPSSPKQEPEPSCLGDQSKRANAANRDVSVNLEPVAGKPDAISDVKAKKTRGKQTTLSDLRNSADHSSDSLGKELPGKHDLVSLSGADSGAVKDALPAEAEIPVATRRKRGRPSTKLAATRHDGSAVAAPSASPLQHKVSEMGEKAMSSKDSSLQKESDGITGPEDIEESPIDQGNLDESAKTKSGRKREHGGGEVSVIPFLVMRNEALPRLVRERCLVSLLEDEAAPHSRTGRRTVPLGSGWFAYWFLVGPVRMTHTGCSRRKGRPRKAGVLNLDDGPGSSNTANEKATSISKDEGTKSDVKLKDDVKSKGDKADKSTSKTGSQKKDNVHKFIRNSIDGTPKSASKLMDETVSAISKVRKDTSKSKSSEDGPKAGQKLRGTTSPTTGSESEANIDFEKGKSKVRESETLAELPSYATPKAPESESSAGKKRKRRGQT